MLHAPSKPLKWFHVLRAPLIPKLKHAENETFELSKVVTARRTDYVPCPVARGISLAIDHPGNAEAIDTHAESFGPESLLKLHLDGAVFFQRLEDPFTLGDVTEA